MPFFLLHKFVNFTFFPTLAKYKSFSKYVQGMKTKAYTPK
ncbi:hypothetical protein JCM19302_2269 [Jejuia pallidilutea]|uniref:Uncharacterized protein n=1 Tax=Jejuia pallidilutea TaxID=504487 RepID=A0A090WYX0_9FLAO|nr:hypothetical protein JCM19302_2269 [Jejuia pallidilutea]